MSGTGGESSIRVIAGLVTLVLLVLTACDSGGDDSAASRTFTTTSTSVAATVEAETLSEYLVIVLRAARDAGVSDASANLLVVPTIDSYRTVLSAVESHLAELATIAPPPEAAGYHDALVEQTTNLSSLYTDLIDAITVGDAARLQQLQTESESQVAAALETAERQNDLLRIALEGRTDPLAVYVVETTALSERFGDEVPEIFDRLNAVLLSGTDDVERLASPLEDEANLLQTMAREWAQLHPPQAAAETHVRRLQVIGGMAGYLDQAAAAARSNDDDLLNDAFQGLFEVFGSVPETNVAQQNLVIAALEREEQTAAGAVTWARVPDQRDLPFGFLFDVVSLDDALVGMGPVPYLSSDGASWFPAPIESDGFEAMAAVTRGGPGLVAVGVAESETGLDAAVWTSADGTAWVRRDTTGLDTAERQQMQAVAVGAAGSAAIGFSGEPDDPTAAIWFSTDFDVWLPGTITDEDMNAVEIEDVAVAGSTFVAVGSGIWSSDNGLDWTRRGQTTGAQFRAVAARGSGFVAVGTMAGDGDADAAVWVSSDGVEWARMMDPDLGGSLNQIMVDVVVVGDGLMGIGTESVPGGAFGMAVWMANPSGDWTRLPLGETLEAEAAQSPVAVTAGGQGVVVVGAAAGSPAIWLGFIDG